MRLRASLLPVVAVIMLIAFAAPVVAGELTADHRDPLAPKPVATSLSERLAAHFGVFRRPARAADATDGAVGADEAAPNLASAGANVHLARRVGPADEALKAVAGNEEICLLGAGTSNCAPESVAIAGRMIGYERCAPDLERGRVRVMGLLPDGVTTVAAMRGDRPATKIAVVDNGFVAVLPGSTTSLEYDLPSGRHAEPIRSLPSYLPDCAA